MNIPSHHNHLPASLHQFVLLLLFFCATALATSGCQSNSHTSNPRLRKIDEMLSAQLPNGTPRSRVMFFLNSRGFSEEYSSDPKALIGLVRLVDTETLQPATARVTFHFDPQDKLTTYDMQSAPDNPSQ